MAEVPKVSEQFKQAIVRWVKYDDDLKKIRETVKEINDEKSKLKNIFYPTWIILDNLKLVLQMVN